MKAESEEKRSHTRVQVRTEVVVQSLDEAFRADADTRDISFKSVYLRTDRRPPLNRHCDLEISMGTDSSGSRLSIRVKGRVVRHDDGGVGIVFEGVDLDSYFDLKKLLLQNTADPIAIEREAPL